ncbi:MAG: hypothetical protein KGL39_29510 [Patescibacteria group bacterium]|nr:hypothetical protein [Patescibacteria group bacterium]
MKPTDFALDFASHQARAVENFVQLAHAIMRETNDPQFVINALFGSVITFAHDTGADPHKLQTAFRKMGELVFQVYAQRDRVIREAKGMPLAEHNNKKVIQ